MSNEGRKLATSNKTETQKAPLTPTSLAMTTEARLVTTEPSRHAACKSDIP
eukprot:CAMPEP_0203804280 /NCGR_PEP_ID=MMETSP0100_2-20121128/13454_1 /ASSEMBLY_ACC=CAM_ASM_000210 /TAXON_ID=96639 /ORGANISM=" , Strain NY0313808BC1" /LENGTH=50 /DNA_ID=CAMNT_0050712395 /DNA_START=148 /DNA_END=297 /DNA_ORIENTATION=-